MRLLSAGFAGCFFISVGSFAKRSRPVAACRQNKTLDLGSAIGAGLDRQDTPNDVGAILHDAQAHPPPTRGIDSKATAIIFDAKSDVSGLCRQPDLDSSGFSVLDGIVNPFLGDPIELQSDGLAHGQNRPVAAQSASDTKEVFRFAGQLLEGWQESVGFDFDRIES